MSLKYQTFDTVSNYDSFVLQSTLEHALRFEYFCFFVYAGQMEDNLVIEINKARKPTTGAVICQLRSAAVFAGLLQRHDTEVNPPLRIIRVNTRIF